MKVGLKARGDKRGKVYVSHHGSRMRHGKGRPVEKAIETAVRRRGKEACRAAEYGDA